MTFSNVTPSAITRVIACPASAVLPQTVVPPGKWALAGTKAHSEIEHALLTGGDHPVRQFAIPFNAPRVFVEPTITIDVYTLEAINHGTVKRENRPYAPDRLVGTMDFVAHEDSGRITVVDWKSGNPRGLIAYQKQLETYAWMFSRYADSRDVECVIAHTGGKILVRFPLSAMDLDRIEDEILTLHSSLGEMDRLPSEEKKRLPVVRGTHCKYCPAQDCPHNPAMKSFFSADSSNNPNKKDTEK